MRGLDVTRHACNAALTDNRVTNYQCQVSPERMWIKNIIVETSLIAPQLTTITTNATALAARVST